MKETQLYFCLTGTTTNTNTNKSIQRVQTSVKAKLWNNARRCNVEMRTVHLFIAGWTVKSSAGAAVCNAFAAVNYERAAKLRFVSFQTFTIQT